MLLKLWNAPMVETIVRKNKVGESRGRVMYLNNPQLRAPSILAESYMSCEILVRPASTMTALKPTVCQRVKTITLNSASLGPAAHSGTDSPNGCRTSSKKLLGSNSQACGGTPTTLSR